LQPGKMFKRRMVHNKRSDGPKGVEVRWKSKDEAIQFMGLIILRPIMHWHSNIQTLNRVCLEMLIYQSHLS
jgi:hypothetical protein